MNHNQKTIIFVMLVCGMLLFSWSTAHSEQINALIQDQSIMITLKATPFTITTNENGKDLITMDEFGTLLRQGCPKLPSKVFYVSLPAMATFTSIELVNTSSILLKGTYDVIETKPLFPLGSPMNSSQTQIQQNGYDPYPTEIFTFEGYGKYQQIPYLKIRFTPFTYYPQEQMLYHHHKITLKISYDLSESHPYVLPQSIEDRDYARSLIENLEALPIKQSSPFSTSNETYEYVIITTEEFVESVIFLQYWRELTGYSTKIITNSWIFDQYPGSDEPEKIRAFLLDKYLDWNIQYVLIVGSDSLIPMKDCFPDDDNHGFGGMVPTDYYYADLTGDWDADQDGYCGESGDDYPDFTAEVFVGRLPVTTPEMAEHICQKIIEFEQTDDDWKSRALLIGALLTLKNEDHSNYDKTDGAYLMNSLIMRVFNPKQFEVTTLYEEEGLTPSVFTPDFPLTHEEVITQISQGYGFVNWNAHGLSTATYRLYWKNDDGDGVPEGSETSSPAFINSRDISCFNDSTPAIFFSCSCENAHPEYRNLGVALLEQGAVSFIGATRNAWGTVGWTDVDDGGCTTLDHLFSEYLIERDETVGAALYKAKHDYFNGYYRWGWQDYQNLYDFNVYGDPATSFTSMTLFVPPNTPSRPEGPDQVVIKDDVVITTLASDGDGHQLFYQWDLEDEGLSSWMGPFESGEQVYFEHQWEQTGRYNISVRVKDVAGMISPWSEPMALEITAPDIQLEGIRSGIGSFRCILRNQGDAEATNVSWHISLENGLHLLSEAHGMIESLPAGKKAIIRNPFIFGFGLPVISVEYESDKLERQSDSTTAMILGPLIMV